MLQRYVQYILGLSDWIGVVVLSMEGEICNRPYKFYCPINFLQI